jgi:cytochrome c-type biogenesis protein CcmH
MFWIIVSLLVLVAIAILSFRLWRKSAPPAMDEAVDALNVLRDQRNELDEEVAAGRMGTAEREARITELTRRVHDEGLTAPAARAASTAPATAAHPTRSLWLALAVTILIPAIAVPVYFVVGTPAALDPAARAASVAPSPHGDFTPEQLRAMLDKLKARLEAKPDDVTGWVMLGRVLQLVDDFAGSAAAFEKAAALRPGDAQLLADYADSLAMSRNRNLSGKPWELIQQALRIDPQLPKALALAASAEFDQGRFQSAKGYWQRMLAVIPPDSEDAAEIRTMIAQMDGKGAGAVPQGAPLAATPAAPPAAMAAGAAPAVPGKSVTGTVRLAPALAAKVKPDDVVYIFARAPEGPRVPLAIVRLKASELPKQFRLDDSLGMAGGPVLSSVPLVKIEARISKSGEALPKPGDLSGESRVVAPGAGNVEILIDRAVP